MTVVEHRVSQRGQMALPAEIRRRWNLDEGGSVEIADLGTALLVAPGNRGGLRGLLVEAIARAGGYPALSESVAAAEPDLA